MSLLHLCQFPESNYVIWHDESNFQQEFLRNIQSNEDLSDFLTSTSETGQLIHELIDLQVTDGRINNCQIKNQLQSLQENVLRSQYPIKILFSDKSKFVRQNTNSTCLLEEVDKKTIEKKLMLILKSHYII